MTGKTMGSYSAAYGYNYGDKLTSVTSNFPWESAVTYAYGGDGKRRSRTAGGVTAQYKWGAGFDLVNEETSAGALSRTYYGRLADVPGTDPATGAYRYYHHDHLGSTRRVTDQSKATLAAYEYAPYGEDLFASGPADVMYRYATLARDGASGLDFAPFRYYSPGTGSWISRDPLGMVDSTNMYAYVALDPANYLDPYGDGLMSWFGGRRGDWGDQTIEFVGTCISGWLLGAAASLAIGSGIASMLGGAGTAGISYGSLEAGGAFLEFPAVPAWGLGPSAAGGLGSIGGSMAVYGIEYFGRPFTSFSHGLYNASASVIGAPPARRGCF